MHLANVGYLGVKEFRSLLRDPIMLLIVCAFTVSSTLRPQPCRRLSTRHRSQL